MTFGTDNEWAKNYRAFLSHFELAKVEILPLSMHW